MTPGGEVTLDPFGVILTVNFALLALYLIAFNKRHHAMRWALAAYAAVIAVGLTLTALAGGAR